MIRIASQLNVQALPLNDKHRNCGYTQHAMMSTQFDQLFFLILIRYI